MSTDCNSPPQPTYRIEHYQNDSDVVVSVLIKKLNPEDVTVTFSPDNVRIKQKYN